VFFQNGSYSGVHGKMDQMGAEWRRRECRCKTIVLGLAADLEPPAELTSTKVWAPPPRESCLIGLEWAQIFFFF